MRYEGKRGSGTDLSLQVARKTPLGVQSLAQDATDCGARRTRHARKARSEVRSSEFGVRSSENLELRTSNPRVSLVPPVSRVLCCSERFEPFRKTKILAVIDRTIDHGRLSARERIVQHRPQFRR